MTALAPLAVLNIDTTFVSPQICSSSILVQRTPAASAPSLAGEYEAFVTYNLHTSTQTIRQSEVYAVKI